MTDVNLKDVSEQLKNIQESIKFKEEIINLKSEIRKDLADCNRLIAIKPEIDDYEDYTFDNLRDDIEHLEEIIRIKKYLVSTKEYANYILNSTDLIKDERMKQETYELLDRTREDISHFKKIIALEEEIIKTKEIIKKHIEDNLNTL